MNSVSLSTVLNFFSGADDIPPGGFPLPPAINFNSRNIYPTASTCAVELTLPTQYHDDYDLFKEKLDTAFTCHGGFGLC